MSPLNVILLDLSGLKIISYSKYIQPIEPPTMSNLELLILY